MRRLVVFCSVAFCGVLLLFGTGLCLAQSTTDGAIGGTVYDKTGAVVGSAKIVVHNNGTNAEQTANADSSGYYHVAGLQPGSYTVTITGGGLAPYKAERVIVQVGTQTEVSPHLGVAGASETVDVTAEAPQINYTSPDFAQVMDQVAIANLPINGGRWSNFALLTPGVVSDSNAFGLLSFRGISTLLNNNTVDGADNNQAFFSEERGRTRIGYSTPKEAVQEFQVNTSNFSAEYGRAAGGVVNTVTKSGTNSIHGSGYFFDRDNDWGAFNEFTQINVQTSPGVFTSQPFKPTDWRKMAGFGVGGPLLKDKLFWYVAYDWYHHNFPGVAVTSNPGGPNGFFATQTTSSPNIIQFARNLNHLSQATTPSAAQDQAALNLYNNDIAGLNTLLGQVAREGDQNIFFPKLDWNINSQNHASFSFNRMRWQSPAGIQTAAAVTRGVASFGNDFVKDTWGVAKLDTMITNNFANELRFQYGRDFEFEFAQPPTPYELANIVNGPTFHNPSGLPPTVSLSGFFTFGVPNFLNRNAFPDETRTQIADTMTWSHGKHTLKYGFDFSHVDDNAINLFNGFGSYTESSNKFSPNAIISYFTDLNVKNGCGGTECYSSFSQGLGLPGIDFTVNNYSIFAQDDWKVLPRLSLSLGLRYEFEKLPNVFLGNPLAGVTFHKPSDKNNIGPRVGFAWDIFGNGKTVLRGGYGIYYGPIITSTIFNALTVTAAPGSQVSVSFGPTSAGAPQFPAVLTSLSGAGKNLDYFDAHFQNPQIHEMDLRVERDLGWGTVLAVSYLGSLGRELPDFVDTNICLTATQAPACAGHAPTTVTYNVVGGGPLAGPTYTTSLFTTRANPAFGAMTDIFSGVNSSYHALSFELNHRMSHNVQFGASYTWSHAIDYGQNQTTFTSTNSLLFPNSVAPEKGNSIYDVPSRFVVNAIIRSPWKRDGWAGWLANGWELSPIVQVQNGLPYTLSISGSAPGGIPNGGGINGSGGTSRLDVLGNNSFRMPYTLEPDVRLSKSFAFREKYHLEVMGDFFNIINKQNVMSVQTLGYSISGNNLTFNPTFRTITGTNNSNFLYTPRQIQIGARVSF